MQKLTQELLKSIINYDPDTGIFTWLNRDESFFNSKLTFIMWNKRFANIKTGNKDREGYIKLSIFGKSYKAHRIAWLYVYGYMPENQIDHINSIKHDNRINNLRDITNAANKQNLKKCHINNSTGLLGVYLSKGKFSSSIMLDGGKKYLGSFETKEQAHKAYINEKRAIHIHNTL